MHSEDPEKIELHPGRFKQTDNIDTRCPALGLKLNIIRQPFQPANGLRPPVRSCHTIESGEFIEQLTEPLYGLVLPTRQGAFAGPTHRL